MTIPTSSWDADGAPVPAPPAPTPPDASQMPDGTLVTCDLCSFPHPKGDDGRPCRRPRLAEPAPAPSGESGGRAGQSFRCEPYTGPQPTMEAKAAALDVLLRAAKPMDATQTCDFRVPRKVLADTYRALSASTRPSTSSSPADGAGRAP